VSARRGGDVWRVPEPRRDGCESGAGGEHARVSRTRIKGIGSLVGWVFGTAREKVHCLVF
jgi:hypothetical protein